MKSTITLSRVSFLLKQTLLLFVFSIPFFIQAQNNFNKSEDIFIAQFDNLPDTDDVHSQAAVASLLAHPDFEGVNYFCVAGAWGVQSSESRWSYINSRSLFSLGFGQEALEGASESQWASSNWVDAHGEMTRGSSNGVATARSQDRIDQMDFATDVIAFKAQSVLEAGGRVFVMEAGQSDVSAFWVRKLNERGVANVDTNVIIVQHSAYNRRQTSGNSLIFQDDLDDNFNPWNYVTNDDNNVFISIADGNSENDTPNYQNFSTVYIPEAIGSDNPNPVTRAIWAEAKSVADTSLYTNGPIPEGGIDFSDAVEAMWIFDIADESDGYHTVREFFDEFVVYISDDTETTNNAPTVSISTPTNNNSFDEGEVIDLEAIASDSDGSIAQVQFFVNGNLIQTERVIPYTAIMEDYDAGSYTITAIATDNDGATTTSGTVTITIDNEETSVAPIVEIITPSSASSFEEGITINLEATASDSDGSIAQVQFFVNGNLIQTERVVPYTATMSDYDPGNYTIVAIATDNEGNNTTSTTVNISIGNAPSTDAPIGSIIWLRAYTGNYVTNVAGNDNLVDASATSLQVDNVGFLIEDAGDGLVALKSILNEQYISADIGISEETTPLIANRTRLREWEKFEWVSNSNGSISLKSDITGKYVAADNIEGSNRPLIANRDAIGSWERFNWGELTSSKNLFSDADIFEITVFPNPTTDIVTIEPEIDITKIQLFSINGQELMSQATNQLNLSNLAKGVYIVRILSSKGKIYTKQIVKK